MPTTDARRWAATAATSSVVNFDFMEATAGGPPGAARPAEGGGAPGEGLAVMGAYRRRAHTPHRLSRASQVTPLAPRVACTTPPPSRVMAARLGAPTPLAARAATGRAAARARPAAAPRPLAPPHAITNAATPWPARLAAAALAALVAAAPLPAAALLAPPADAGMRYERAATARAAAGRASERARETSTLPTRGETAAMLQFDRAAFTDDAWAAMHM